MCIPFYDAALLPILRHNSIFLYANMSTGAILIAPIFHKGQAAMEATEQDSNARDWLNKLLRVKFMDKSETKIKTNDKGKITVTAPEGAKYISED